MPLSHQQLLAEYNTAAKGSPERGFDPVGGLRAVERAATAPLLAQIAALEAWKAKIIKSSEQAYGESAIRYKFSLTKNGKCMNTFPKEIDGRWFALTPAEDDSHIGHIARIAQLEAQLAEARKDAERFQFAADPQSDGFAVCEWIDGDWIPINTEDLDAAIAQEQT